MAVSASVWQVLIPAKPWRDLRAAVEEREAEELLEEELELEEESLELEPLLELEESESEELLLELELESLELPLEEELELELSESEELLELELLEESEDPEELEEELELEEESLELEELLSVELLVELESEESLELELLVEEVSVLELVELRLAMALVARRAEASKRVVENFIIQLKWFSWPDDWGAVGQFIPRLAQFPAFGILLGEGCQMQGSDWSILKITGALSIWSILND